MPEPAAQIPAAGPPLRRRAFLGTMAAGGAVAAGLAAGPTSSSAAATPSAADQAAGPDRRHRRRFRFGVNYVPSKNWWFSWSDWNRRSIAADLDDIASLGMDHIRIMLLWSELQPNASYARTELLDRLAELLDLADERGLDVEVTVFNGAVSGFLFIPPYLVDNGTGRVRNVLTDPDAIAAEQWLLGRIAGRIGRHRRFLGFDLSNEINWFGLPLGMAVTPAQGDAWHRALFDTCQQVAPGRVHVSGLDHYAWLTDDYFSRPGIASAGTVTANHTWAGWTGVIQRYGTLSTPSTHYSEYFIELIKAFHTDLDREVWIEETGTSTRWMAAADIPAWTERSIRTMASCDHLFGITWWCSHDLNPALVGYNPLEYDLGLYTNDRRLKPIGATIARLIAEYDATPPEPLARRIGLVLPDDMIPSTPVLERFMALVDAGTPPAVVLRSRSTDTAYLAARGIERLVTLDQAS
jgi:Cellulase (glycosyl hydrolase family 5)